jgi:5-methyltetrahydrofolate--homocysteine methyltransferase
MGKITSLLNEKKIVLSDGAWGTLMQAKGLKAGDCPELWNFDRREDILNIAKSYIAAGSDLVKTNSFGGNKLRLEHYGLEGKVREINKTAAEISREAAGSSKIVMGSIGPTGKMLFMGDVTEEELYDCFAEQAAALQEGGADAALIETFSAVDEALCAIKAVKENTNLEIICTFTFEKTADNQYKTMMGVSAKDMAVEIPEAGADIIGTNCGNGIERMVDIIREIKNFSGSKPILVHSNAGLPVLKDGKVKYLETPEIMSSFLPAIISAGANIVGGCCGTTPRHIEYFKKVIESF